MFSLLRRVFGFVANLFTNFRDFFKHPPVNNRTNYAYVYNKAYYQDEAYYSFDEEICPQQQELKSFRETPLYPMQVELSERKVINMQKNRIHGDYASTDEYLGIHFQLLREDFMEPLRQSLKAYSESKNLKQHAEKGTTNIYWNVKFLGFERTKNSVGMRISFDLNEELKKLDWDESKRFMNGSLLCFTHDKFQNVFFSTVLVRRLGDLKRGELVVFIPDGSYLLQDVYTKKMIMAESETFFEPYYHVMKTLQIMNCNNFPMKKYIIKVQADRIPQPQYYNKNPEVYRRLCETLYQNEREMKMNSYQYNAYKTGLSKEMAIIQGPPGTGKTFVSLKIAETLLKIHDYSNTHGDTVPILIVCVTNHALDQFLEGLVPFTHDIIRVGGFSESDILGPFNLSLKRKFYNLFKEDLRFYERKKRLLSDILRKLKPVEKSIRILEEKQCVISLQSLKLIADVQHKFNYSDEVFLKWLNLDINNFENLLPCDGNQNASLMENIVRNTISKAMKNQNYIDNFNEALRKMKPSTSVALDINKIEKELKEKEKALDDALTMTKNNACIQNLEENITKLRNCLQFFNLQMRKSFDFNNNLADQIQENRINLWALSTEQRWSLYSCWIELLKIVLQKQVDALLQELKEVTKQCDSAQKVLDVKVMKQAAVVGMTTSGAAKLQPQLEMLQSKIVIIEEAAEVLESHVVASLTKHCQHLILVGDHKQLRPINADYDLAINYNLDVSLFERLVGNEIPCEVLKIQHRMRPEISRLITPSIYPELYNHDSVLHFEDILGVTKNVFFLTHDMPETQVEESKINKHEARFLIALCKYFLAQGYSPSQITILAAYSAQVTLMNNIKSKELEGQDVRITSIDNFQGDENDIILLSLVRSNNENQIGFLKTDNRVCVGLSRARKGLYIMGNMKILSAKSKTWRLIRQELESQHAIDDRLILKCQVHQKEHKFVRNPKDFLRYSPKGGCLSLCNARRQCGHICKEVCHVSDREHTEEYKCQVDVCNRSHEDTRIEYDEPWLRMKDD